MSETSLSRQSIALVLTTKNNQTQHYIHQKHKRETEKTALANKTIYTLIWYAFYDLQPGNGVGPILTAPEPTWGKPTQWVSECSLTSHSAFCRQLPLNNTDITDNLKISTFLNPQHLLSSTSASENVACNVFGRGSATVLKVGDKFCEWSEHNIFLTPHFLDSQGDKILLR